MTLRRYAVLDGEDVVNIIMLDKAEDEYDPGDLTLQVAAEQVGIGWKRVDGKWVTPSTPEEPVPDLDPNLVQAQQESLQELLSKGFTEPTARLMLNMPLE